MAVTLREIAAACGVSRMTVSLALNGKGAGKVSAPVRSRVLAKAEELGYHPNQHARCLRYGTGKDSGSSTDGAVPVTMLLPCSGFLDHPNSDAETLLEIFSGALEAATEYGLSLETLPVSRTNNPQQIEWSWLSKIDSSSLVLAPASWFMLPLLELNRRGCRIALIAPTGFWLNIYSRYIKDWYLLSYRYEESARLLAECFFHAGFNRIALAALESYLAEPDFPLLSGYQQALHTQGHADLQVISISSRQTLSRDLVQAYSERPFEALIYSPTGALSLDYTCSLAANFQLPEELCIASTLDREDYRRLQPQISAISYPFRQMGYDAVQALAQEKFCAGQQAYEGSLELRGALAGLEAETLCPS